MAGGGGVAVFLHLSHILFPIVTIVALHWTARLYDLQLSMDRRKEDREPRDKFYKKCKFTAEDKKDFEKYYPPPTLYCTGLILGIVVGFLCICALAVIILSFVIKLPKLIQWYYLVAAILVLLFVSLELGLSPQVDNYNECMKTASERLKMAKEKDKAIEKAPFQKKFQICEGSDGFLNIPQFIGSPPQAIFRQGEPDAEDGLENAARKEKAPLNGVCVFLSSGALLVPVFELSFAYALTYLAAFILTFFDSSSSSSEGGFSNRGGGGGGYQDQAERDRQQGETSAPTATTTDVEAATATA